MACDDLGSEALSLNEHWVFVVRGPDLAWQGWSQLACPLVFMFIAGEAQGSVPC